MVSNTMQSDRANTLKRLKDFADISEIAVQA